MKLAFKLLTATLIISIFAILANTWFEGEKSLLMQNDNVPKEVKAAIKITLHFFKGEEKISFDVTDISDIRKSLHKLGFVMTENTSLFKTYKKDGRYILAYRKDETSNDWYVIDSMFPDFQNLEEITKDLLENKLKDLDIPVVKEK